ncbi:MAG: hypothetical protein IPF99_43145 [Deltaproteobacteria bacterium]|nr:hypothetical protein [Deltaproteobacteria bacterium]
MRTASMALGFTAAFGFLPATAFAQTAPWTAPPAAAAPTVAAPAVATPMTPVQNADPEVPFGVRYDPNPGARYVLEGLAGIGLGAGVGLGVGLLAYGIVAGSSSSGWDSLFAIAAVGGVGVLMVILLGVTLVGNGRGGNGGYGWSLLGTVGGSLAANLIQLPLLSACEGSSGSCSAARGLMSILSLGAVATGAVLGYELSNDQRRARPPAPRLVQWAPSAAPTRGGLTLGVAGVF